MKILFVKSDQFLGGNDKIQSATYILSSAVIIQILQSVFDVGASIKNIDLQAEKIHQIKQNIESVENKIDKLLLNPLKVADELFKTGLNEI